MHTYGLVKYNMSNETTISAIKYTYIVILKKDNTVIPKREVCIIIIIIIFI